MSEVQIMVEDYTEDMKVLYYTDSESKEIEIVKEGNYLIYFKNIEEFAKLIKSNERLAEDLKKLL